MNLRCWRMSRKVQILVRNFIGNSLFAGAFGGRGGRGGGRGGGPGGPGNKPNMGGKGRGSR